MSGVLPSMRDELGAWNAGRGIDLESWVGCEGNFRLAVGYSTLFWPRFEATGIYILRDGCTPDDIRSFEDQPGATPRSIEAVLNHIHLLDIQSGECEDASADKLVFLGNVLKEIYEAKLARQFPDRPCRVEFLIPADRDELSAYQLTFWQKAFDD